MHIKKILWLLVLVIAMSQPAYAADAAEGRQLAEKWCVKCHNIEKGAPFKLNPPSFASIAVYRLESNIRDKIIEPHVGMIDVKWVLPIEDIDSLVAYITSLEAK